MTLTKKHVMAMLMGAALLSGCSANDHAQKGIHHQNGNTLNVSNRNELYNKGGFASDGDGLEFGYVRHQKSPIEGDLGAGAKVPSVSLELYADIISRICSTLPNVNDVATLVTDEEVLIAYDTDTRNRSVTANQVKWSALSVVPSYYHVYVSDDKQMIQDIERYGRVDSNSKGIESTLEQSIERMKSNQNAIFTDERDQYENIQDQLHEQTLDMGPRAMNNR